MADVSDPKGSEVVAATSDASVEAKHRDLSADAMAPPAPLLSACVQPHQRRHAAVFTAFMGFGLASWIMTNASYIELGVFLRVLPETYGIFAYSIFALQSANAYPFLYMLLNARQQRVRHATTIWVLLVIGVVAALLMSLLWRQTAPVLGKSHSVAMLVLTHLGGLVSATSSVVFYPYVATFPPIYTSALSTGEGLSGSMAALLGIIQRPYDETTMRFSVEVFYILCALIIVISLLSFAFLERHPWSRIIKSSAHRHRHSSGDIELQVGRPLHDNTNEASPLVRDDASRPFTQLSTQTPPSEPSLMASLRPVWPFLLCQLILAAFSFGVLPSVMPYVYKKYAPSDNREAATSRYQTISSIASLILDPLARLVTSWIRVYRVREFTVVLVAIATMLLAFSLQTSPLVSGNPTGYMLPLVAHVGYLVAYAYTQTMIYLTLKRISGTAPHIIVAHRVYQWSGFATQIGAFVGTIVVFPLVFFNEELFLGSA